MSLRVIRRRVWGLMGCICMDHRGFHQFHPQKQGLVRSLKWVWVKIRQRSASIHSKPGPLRVLGLRSLDATIWGPWASHAENSLWSSVKCWWNRTKPCSSYRRWYPPLSSWPELCPFTSMIFPTFSQNFPNFHEKWREISQPPMTCGEAEPRSRALGIFHWTRTCSSDRGEVNPRVPRGIDGCINLSDLS